MKENKMKEHKITEQQLLEEQLHAVTGGCAECINDRLLAAEYLNKAAKKRFKASNPNTYSDKKDELVAKANELHNQATILIHRVWQRESDPNHPQ
jgi:hypothetical protein